jgi:hypothetical protein
VRVFSKRFYLLWEYYVRRIFFCTDKNRTHKGETKMGYVFNDGEVHEVHEHADAYKKAILATGMKRNEQHYANWERDRLWHIYETKAEAKQKMKAEEIREREYDQRQKVWNTEKRSFVKRVHFNDQPYTWATMQDFLSEKRNNKGRALCERRPYYGAKFVTKDKTKVTCANCLLLIQEHANWKGFPKPTKAETEKKRLRALLPWGSSVRRYPKDDADGGYYVTLYLGKESQIKALGELLREKHTSQQKSATLEVVAKSA